MKRVRFIRFLAIVCLLYFSYIKFLSPKLVSDGYWKNYGSDFGMPDLIRTNDTIWQVKFNYLYAMGEKKYVIVFCIKKYMLIRRLHHLDFGWYVNKG
ncbi:MAG: hypothetical protein RL757_594 [Bacteroidota bacterium]|jgi:hypothetical protein